MPSMTREIPKGSPLHQKIVAMITSRIRFAERSRGKQVEKWQKAEELALAWMPEKDMDAVRNASRRGGTPEYTTIQIPYSYGLMMAQHTYMTSVFFARTPVHQFAGRHDEGEQQVQAVEALIGYQVEIGQFLVPYYIWCYDSVKYGLGILQTWWQDDIVQFSNIQEQVDPLTGKSKTLQESIQIPGYRGNKVKNISPFDFYSDPRFPTYRFQEGEYCATRSVMGWNEMIRRKNLGYYMNTDFITSRFAPSQLVNMGASALERPEIPGFILDAEDQGHPMAFYIYEVYVDLIQSEWGLGDSDYPEKWVFTITGDLSLLIGAQPLGSTHGKFPFDIMVGEIEGYGLWTRGTPEIVRPVQNTLDWLLNQHFYNVRAALNNQFIIDPSKIVIRDAEDGGPGFIYRLRPEAYGSDVRTFFYQVPVQDMTRGHVADMDTMMDIGEKITGINDQMFGALAPGRKTATEVRTSTGFGVNRQKTMSDFASAMGMSPHAQKLVQHSQQWYEQDMMLRVMGSLATDAARFIQVTPDSISGFFDLVPVDGTLPIDRMAMANLWQQLMGQMRNFPQLMAQLDMWKLFGYIGQLVGIRNINQFKLQVLPPGQMPQGNVVPLRPGGPTPGPSTPNPAMVPSMIGNAAGPGQNGLDLASPEQTPGV
jgi:hypothetical protein